MDQTNITQKEKEEKYVDELLRKTTDLGVFKMTALIKLIQQQQKCDFEPKNLLCIPNPFCWPGMFLSFWLKITFLKYAVQLCSNVPCLCTNSYV